MSFDDDVAPLCPWCQCFVEASEPTMRYNRVLWHAGCYEDLERAEAKEHPDVWKEARR